MDNNELLSQITSLIKQQESRTSQEITALKVMIENDVTKRIDALFNG